MFGISRLLGEVKNEFSGREDWGGIAVFCMSVLALAIAVFCMSALAVALPLAAHTLFKQ